MSYKTVLVHAGASEGAMHATELAASIAVAHEAHLIGLASTGIVQLVRQCSSVAAGVAPLPDDLSFLTERADAALTAFAQRAAGLGAASTEPRRVDDEIDYALLLHARYCDLLVMAAPGAGGVDDTWPASRVHAVLLHCARPVLLSPAGRAAPSSPPGQRALLGWDGSLQATRAISAAIPLLRRGGLATLAVINPGQDDQAHGALPGADMACYLARHGIAVEVVQRSAASDPGSALLVLVAELDADLLVIGAYGHSRILEMALGGATRTVLRDMALPVLLAH